MVALLCYAGLMRSRTNTINPPPLTALLPADLPLRDPAKLRSVLIIAVLLRFMDSFMIYANHIS